MTSARTCDVRRVRYCFGDFELDEDGRELRRRAPDVPNGASRVEAAPKVLAFLRTLVKSAPRVVTRGELLEAVWQGQAVSPSALNTVVKSLRQVLDDGDQRFVRTMHGIGYAFVTAVERRGAAVPSALSDARQRLFVGRDAELDRLAAWFADPSSDDVRLFWIHGPSGIGKTSLVHRLETLALERHVPAITISCAHLRPSPEALMSAIATCCGAATNEVPSALAASPAGVLVLDAYEAVRGIDDWLRERFVQRLPSGWRLVLSGRNPPGLRWRVDPTWTCAAEILLRDLSPDEARALLERRGVAPSEHDRLLDFAGGHPLTLVLATDSLLRRGGFSGLTSSATDGLMTALIDAFVRESPSRHHRDALDCLAVVDALDEPLLAAMMDDDERARECFEWLSTLGMVERHPAGLVLHDLAKTTLTASLAWRNAARLGGLVERAYTKRFAELEVIASLERRRRIVASIWRLFDLHPVIAPLLSLPKLFGPPSSAELEAIEDHVARVEGPASVAALRFWLARDPACARVIRSDDSEMLGYSVFVKVEPGDREARVADPLLTALDAALDPIGKYSVTRWFADCRAYHDVTPVSVGCQTMNTERELGAIDEELCCHFMLTSNPEVWKPLVRLADMNHKIESFAIHDPRLVAFSHDMRGQTLLTWFRTFTRRILETLTTGAALDLGVSPHGPRSAVPGKSRGTGPTLSALARISGYEDFT